jgi:hypothetical protein
MRIKIVKRKGKSEEKRKKKATKCYAFRSSAFLTFLSLTILGTDNSNFYFFELLLFKSKFTFFPHFLGQPPWLVPDCV